MRAAGPAVNSCLKAIADFESVRGHFLSRYGVVVGLDGTGDPLGNSAFAEESLMTMPRRLGVGMRGLDLETKKVAATRSRRPARSRCRRPTAVRSRLCSQRSSNCRCDRTSRSRAVLRNRVDSRRTAPGVSLQDLVTGLNALGVGARDLIDILQVIKGSRRTAGGNRGDVMGEMSVNSGVASIATSPSGGIPRSDDAEVLPHAAQEFEVVFLDQGLGTMTRDMDGDS